MIFTTLGLLFAVFNVQVLIIMSVRSKYISPRALHEWRHTTIPQYFCYVASGPALPGINYVDSCISENQCLHRRSMNRRTMQMLLPFNKV
jgi:hypothetical protein